MWINLPELHDLVLFGWFQAVWPHLLMMASLVQKSSKWFFLSFVKAVAMPYKSENKIAITQKTWSENNVWCAIVNTCRNNYFLPLSTDSRLIPKVMKAVAHMSLSNLWEKVWQYLDNSITLLSPILGPIHHWPSKKINSEGISTTLGYWFWEKREILEIICPLTLREFARNSAAWFYVTTLQKKEEEKLP